ncbi:MAG: SdiA-regulated domain-containing protein, partial [Pontibacterium sp.]
MGWTSFMVNPAGAAADETPPVLSLPTSSNITSVGFRANATTDESQGVLYSVAVAAGSNAPSAAQIIAGQDSTGAGALDSAQVAVTATGNIRNNPFTNLAAQTVYDYYSVQQDVAVPANTSNVVSGQVATVVIGLTDVIASFTPESAVLFSPHAASNTSGIGYDEETGRVGLIRNNVALIHEYDAEDLTTLVRTITCQLSLTDTESVTYMGNGEIAVTSENAGAYVISIFDLPEGTEDITIFPKQTLTCADPGADNNSGFEAVTFDKVGQVFWALGEGQQANTPRRIFRFTRPVNRTTDYSFADAEFSPVEPFVAETFFAQFGATGAQFDLVGISMEMTTGDLIIASQTGAMIVQIDVSTPSSPAVRSQLAITGFSQLEGVEVVAGGRLVLVGEANEYRSYTPADTTPDAYDFTNQTGVALNELVTSNTVTITGLEAACAVFLDAGEHNINGTGWSSADAVIENGQTLQLRQISSSSASTPTTITSNVGGVLEAWTVTTADPDTTPDSFDFADSVDQPVSTATTSNAITVSGITAAAAISVNTGEYRINGGSWTASAGTVTNGQTVELRRNSSASNSATVSMILTIGGVSDTWNITTEDVQIQGPVITQPPHAEIAYGQTFTYTPSLTSGSDVFWFKEFGPDSMTVNPETGAISFDTGDLPRGQGLNIGLGCSNEDGEDIKWFCLHVDNTGTSKLVELGVDTVSPYIRIGCLESIFNGGDTLVIPAGHRWASVSSDQDFVNTFADSFGDDMPSGTSSQMTSFVSPGFCIVDAGPHDGIPRQDEALEILTDQATVREWVKWSGIEWTGNNRQAIMCAAPNNYFELAGATDCGYAQSPTTFAEADDAYASVAAGYLQGDGSVCYNSYGFGEGRYIWQAGNPIQDTLVARCIVRPDEYRGDQPRGGITHYSTTNSGIYNNWVIDGDQEHLTPFYKNYAGAFAFPATGNEGYPQSQHFNGNGTINTDMVPMTSDGNSSTHSLYGGNFLAWNTTGTITPQNGFQSPTVMLSDSPTTLAGLSFGHNKNWDNGSGFAFVRAANSTNDLALSDAIIFQPGWNGSAVEDLGTLFNATGGASGNTLDNAYAYGLHASSTLASSAWTVTNANTTDNPQDNGWDYPVRAEEGSPVHASGAYADLTNFKNPSDVMPNDTGWQTETDVWAWPHPAEQYIASRMATYSKTGLPVRNPTTGQNPVDFDGIITGARGFAAPGESFSEYIWGQFGRTVPPLRVAATETGANEVTFRVGKYRSTRGNSITKFNVYNKSDLANPALTFTGLKGVLSGAGVTDADYVIRAVDPTKTTAYGGNEPGESGNSRTMSMSEDVPTTPLSGSATADSTSQGDLTAPGAGASLSSS